MRTEFSDSTIAWIGIQDVWNAMTLDRNGSWMRIASGNDSPVRIIRFFSS